MSTKKVDFVCSHVNICIYDKEQTKNVFKRSELLFIIASIRGEKKARLNLQNNANSVTEHDFK